MVDRSSREARRQAVERAYARGIEAVEPGNAVRNVLARTKAGFSVSGEEIVVPGRLVVVAIGKAAASMAKATVEILGDAVDRGMLITKDGHGGDAPVDFDTYEASHPVPDDRGIRASDSALRAVDTLGPDDGVLALISGGGSALFEAPVEGLALDDIQQVTDLLLRAGAPIQDLNAVRSELSQVKGGGFRQRIGEATTVSLILSDVLGNSPDVIASGPTVSRQPNPEQAIALLKKYGLEDRVPEAVCSHLEASTRSRPSNRIDDEQDIFRIIGDNEVFVAAVQDELESQGYSVERLWREREGEARNCGAEWVRELAGSTTDVILGGGELTVTVRGDGTGGRNTEFALAAAIALEEMDINGTVASLASDGQDGGVDAAGAVVDETTVHSLRQAGIDPEDALARNDSGAALGEIGALVVPGPTGTNVNDVYIGMRCT